MFESLNTQSKQEGGEKMVKDPVCGMEVDEKTTKHKTGQKGKTYYFCCSSCQKTFEEKPDKYIKM